MSIEEQNIQKDIIIEEPEIILDETTLNDPIIKTSILPDQAISIDDQNPLVSDATFSLNKVEKSETVNILSTMDTLNISDEIDIINGIDKKHDFSRRSSQSKQIIDMEPSERL